MHETTCDGDHKGRLYTVSKFMTRVFGCAGDHTGHVIGYAHFGGSNACINTVPMNGNLNQGAYKNAEDYAATSAGLKNYDPKLIGFTQQVKISLWFCDPDYPLRPMHILYTLTDPIGVKPFEFWNTRSNSLKPKDGTCPYCKHIFMDKAAFSL